MEFREAEQSDVPMLAEINRQLIEDEWEGNAMSLPRLEARMSRWLRDGDYRAVLFHEDGVVVAYCLVSVDEDSAYIRHFYVLREHRRGGTGRRAMELLLRDVVPAGLRITLDVLASNAGGHGFWRSVGFRDYSVRMELLPRSVDSAAAAAASA